MNEPGLRAPRATLQETVQERVKQFIIENDHRAGDPLPPESELARRLGISRPSLREAMRVLQTIGVVESRHGSGTYVGRFRMDTLVDGMSFSIQASSETNAVKALGEILEVREVLEGYLIGKYASTISAAELNELDALCDRMMEHARARETFPAEELAFHEALYTRSGNSLIVQLVRAFWQVFDRAEASLSRVDSELTAIVESHRQIVEALRSGDSAAAEASMSRHFDGLRDRLSQASSSQSVG